MPPRGAESRRSPGGFVQPGLDVPHQRQCRDGDNDSGTHAHAPGIFGAELVQRPLKVACSTVRFRSTEDLARLDGGGGDACGGIEGARGQGWIGSAGIS